jgi:hypothetical protein
VTECHLCSPGFWGFSLKGLVVKDFMSRQDAALGVGVQPGCLESKASVPPFSLANFPFFSLQLELITTQATRAGFTGGVVVDYPNSAKAKK